MSGKSSPIPIANSPTNRRGRLSPRRKSVLAKSVGKLLKNSPEKVSIGDALKNSVELVSPRRSNSNSNSNGASPSESRKTKSQSPGRLALIHLVKRWDDKKMHSILHRFAWGLEDESARSLCSEIRYLGVVQIWEENPTVDGAVKIYNDFLAIAEEAKTGKICPHGLYGLSGTKVLQDLCDAIKNLRDEMEEEVAEDLTDLRAAEERREKLNCGLDKKLFDPLTLHLLNHLKERYSNKDGKPGWYLPDSKVAAALLRVLYPDENGKKATEDEVNTFLDDLKTGQLGNGKEINYSDINESEILAEAGSKLANHYVFIPKGTKCQKGYIDEMVHTIACKLMAYTKEGRNEIDTCEETLCVIHSFIKEKGMAEALKSLEKVTHWAHYRLTKGVCSDQAGNDMSARALPPVTDEVRAIARREVELLQGIALLDRVLFQRTLWEREKEALDGKESQYSWDQFAKSNGLKPPRFSVKGKVLPRESYEAFKDAFAKSLREKSADSDRCREVLRLTSKFARSIFDDALRNYLCPALWNTQDELYSAVHKETIHYDVLKKKDKSLEVATTVTYGVEWWPKENRDAEEIGQFTLRLAFQLPSSEIKPRQIKSRQMSISPSNLVFQPNVPYELQKKVLDALQGIEKNRTNTSRAEKRKIKYNPALRK